MSIQHLPTELLERIILSASHTEWTTLRLVSHTFDALITPRLFRHLTVWLQTRSLQRLVQISQTPRLNSLVQSLEIGTEFLGMRNPSQHEFLQTLYRYLREWSLTQTGAALTLDDITNIVHRPDLGGNDGPIYKAWQAYCLLVREQSTLIRTSMDVAFLGIAFSNLSRLKIVKLCIRKSRSDPTSWGTAAIEDRILVSPSFLGTSYQPLMNGHWLRSLVVSLAASGTSLTTFEIHGVYDWADLKQADLDAASSAFANLRSLSLSLGRFKAGLEARLVHFMKRFPQVTHLRLSLEDHKNDQLDTTPILNNIALETLQSIELAAFRFRPHVFEGFLRRHADTLRSVKLDHPMLISGTFEALFRTMRKVTRLDELELVGSLVEFHGEKGTSNSNSNSGGGSTPSPPHTAASTSNGETVTYSSLLGLSTSTSTSTSPPISNPTPITSSNSNTNGNTATTPPSSTATSSNPTSTIASSSTSTSSSKPANLFGWILPPPSSSEDTQNENPNQTSNSNHIHHHSNHSHHTNNHTHSSSSTIPTKDPPTYIYYHLTDGQRSSRAPDAIRRFVTKRTEVYPADLMIAEW